MKSESISKTAQERLLINKSGSGKYNDPSCVENLLRYIARENHITKDDLICCGAIGATDFTDINTTIQQFQNIQSCYDRNGSFGRYIDHEIFSFSPEVACILTKDLEFANKLARRLADDFYENEFQVYYGVHIKDQNNPVPHIHFATNTISFVTKKKRHENYKSTKNREERLNKIVNDSLQNYLSENSNK